MRIALVLFLAALLAIASHVDARYVSHSSSSSDDDSSLSSVVKQLKVPVEDVAIIKSKSLISRQLTHLEEKRSFVDLLPYVGSFIFRGVVRRVLIRPVVNGMKVGLKSVVPSALYTRYRDVLMANRVVKVISPLSPLLSSYAYNKFEQGVFWGIKRGWVSTKNFASNFIEFERKKRK